MCTVDLSATIQLQMHVLPPKKNVSVFQIYTCTYLDIIWFTSQFLIQNTQEIKNAFYLDETCSFSRKSSFSSYVQYKNRKTINSTYLVSVTCSEAGGRKRA